MFWTELCILVQDWVNSEKIKLNLNQAKLQKVRKIEDFWSILKEKVYEKLIN